MEPIEFRSEDGVVLRGELRLPDAAPAASAVLCHPHPRQGGSKDHPLLWAIRNDLASRGFAVLSFNFRGVLGSGGEYGAGITEFGDARAAVGRARESASGPTFVCGWSFGANVALREAVHDERVGGLALIGLPLGEPRLDLPELPDLPGRERLRTYGRSVLLLAGEADPFCPVPELQRLGRHLANARVEIVPGTDHFFWKREGEAAGIVGAFALAAMASAGGTSDAPG